MARQDFLENLVDKVKSGAEPEEELTAHIHADVGFYTPFLLPLNDPVWWRLQYFRRNHGYVSRHRRVSPSQDVACGWQAYRRDPQPIRVILLVASNIMTTGAEQHLSVPYALA